LDWVSAVDSQGRTIWIVDAHRDDGKRFVVRADEILSAFVELERQLLTVTFYLECRARRLLRQCFQPVEQIFLARDADNLVAQLAVFEEKQRRNRANVVLG
jgi:hypothetical protein